MEGSGGYFPQAGLCVDERLDLEARQLESLLLEGRERFSRGGHETPPKIFVGDDLSDEQLYSSL
jgi:hypothetical protein